MSGVRVPSAALEDVRNPAYALRPALHGCTSGEVAQLVEHRIENAGVGGSSPPLATSIAVPLKGAAVCFAVPTGLRPRLDPRRDNAAQWRHAALNAWPASAPEPNQGRW